MSSGGERALDFRPPLDIVNMSRLFGLTDIQCKAAITTVGRAALLHSSETPPAGMRGFLTMCVFVCVCACAGMRRHSAKAVVSSHPLPAGRRKREREQDSETSVKKLRKDDS